MILSVLQVDLPAQQRRQYGYDGNKAQTGRAREDREEVGKIHRAKIGSAEAQALTPITGLSCRRPPRIGGLSH
jgi:hypothetical protein